MSVERLYVGVDVGSGSARAALVTGSGRMVRTARHDLTLREQGGHYEQSSDDIWEACCKSVRMIMKDIPKTQVRGIGFDATCSLVVLDEEYRPLTVSPSGINVWNVIMWMDHRATEQAGRITRTCHEALRSFGGTMSPGLQIPKLLWLKEHMRRECWDKVGHFFDLSDFLTWKASGSLSRSLCPLVCSWAYRADRGKIPTWDDNFLTTIGLQDLIDNNYLKIGSDVRAPGEPCGAGLSEESAADLGLAPGTPVATSMIDAHCGGLGTIGCKAPATSGALHGLTSRLALVSGTSTCHMTVRDEPLFMPGIKGPRFSAMVPGFYLIEGGQTATGKLLDFIIEKHAAYSRFKEEAQSRKLHVHDILSEVLEERRERAALQDVTYLTKSLHVWPDFHGNRTPVGDPTLRGMISGLTLDSGVEALARLYLATLQALAYGTRHILERMREGGHTVRVLHACGGLSKNRLYLQTHADITGLPLLIPDVKEPVLLGAAMLGACASRDMPSIQDAMEEMGGAGTVLHPNQSTTSYHNKKYQVFLKMLEHQRQYQTLME